MTQQSRSLDDSRRAMQDWCAFMAAHPIDKAYHIIKSVLGNDARRVSSGSNNLGHALTRVMYPKSFDLFAVEAMLGKQLDAIEWQFVTLGEEWSVQGEVLPCFGMAPIVPKQIDVAFHATRVCTIALILSEGLLTSTSSRRVTDYPDLDGKIHACEKLKEDGGKDSAEWWMQHLSQKNIHRDTTWGIVRIDLRCLAEARIYQDMHSQSGLVIDRIDRISPDRLEWV